MPSTRDKLNDFPPKNLAAIVAVNGSRFAMLACFGISFGILLMGCGAPVVSETDKSATDRLATSETRKPIAPATAKPQPVTDPAQYLPIKAVAKMAGREILLEVAETPQEQARGLMFRAPLPDDRGMLFPFTPARPVSFWMKNTPSPLDMIFLLNGRVQAIARNATMCKGDPCPIYPESAVIADNVIEVRAGLTQELGLQEGDQVMIEFVTLEKSPEMSPEISPKISPEVSPKVLPKSQSSL